MLKGDPLDPKAIIGPIITDDAVKLIDDGVKEAVAWATRDLADNE
jgi:hypothetical protein